MNNSVLCLFNGPCGRSVFWCRRSHSFTKVIVRFLFLSLSVFGLLVFGLGSSMQQALALNSPEQVATESATDSPATSAAIPAPATESIKFRVDNSVQMEKGDEILEIKTSTIFADNMVFDFIGDYGEIIIYRPELGIFTLLDPLHRIQTELSCAEIDSFLVNIRDQLLEKKDKFQTFVLNPAFEISTNDDDSEFILQSKWLEYTIKTRSFDEERIANEYFLFSNAYCKLNIYLNPGSTTPFARLKVNQILQEHSRFPEEFHTTIWPNGKWFLGRTVKIESLHTFVHRLSERDEGRLVRAIHFSRQFPKVSFIDYYKKSPK